MQDIAEFERRITAALERIGHGVEALSAAAALQAELKPLAGPPTLLLPESDFAVLNEALDEERMLNAQLNERLRALRDKDTSEKFAATEQVQRLNAQLDAQSGELARLRETVAVLNDELSDLRNVAELGVTEPEHINKAMLTELQALRAARAAEAEELAEIVAALTPLIEEATHA